MISMALNAAQARQIYRQLQEHRHETYSVDITLGKNAVLRDFCVFKDIMRPERMTSLRLARFLWENPKLYADHVAIDVGTGSGLQGLTMARGGARYAVLSDISDKAVANAKENIERCSVGGIAEAIESDLFQNISLKARLIVFNHPFFPASPKHLPRVAISMLDDGGLIKRFLEDSKRYLADGGNIIMPFFHLAGEVNDPKIQGEAHGYKVEEVYSAIETETTQAGRISINRLTL